MRLCRVDWITVTRYYIVSLTGCIVAYSPSRTPRRDLYPGYGTVITSGRPYYYVSTGYPYSS